MIIIRKLFTKTALTNSLLKLRFEKDFFFFTNKKNISEPFSITKFNLLKNSLHHYYFLEKKAKKYTTV